ncbi:NAD(P)-dependent alcohol dehydrogenase [Ruegeria arenilitoris]|uniref:NAD(P)-dependent alcohol dehydrogenase n=1 Tax=Ruegeria arenilitoris TaxID=1173585 RepID=UPI001CFF0E84|nr:NAD(P)-dependent alcohol dehydrogenase [Ruegeria arenilitoris]
MLDNVRALSTVYRAAKSMTAIALTELPEPGNVAEALQLVNVPVPRPSRHQVAIQLFASSLHVDEIYAAQGTALGRFFGPKRASANSPYVMGTSVSGVVVATGQDATRFNVGDEVIVVPNELGENGSWATYRCVSQDYVMHKPRALSHVEAAAAMLSGCVAWGTINAARVEKGDHCMVVGASGAIGSLMVQFLKAKGAIVTGVCSGANADLVRTLGADHTIDYNVTSFGSQGQNTYDRVFDLVGGRDIEAAAYRILKRNGRFVTIVGPVRHIGERKLSRAEFLLGVGHIVCRSIATRFRGPRYRFCASLPRNNAYAAILSIAKHNIRSPIEAEIPFDLPQIQAAIRTLTSHRTRGRIIINFEAEKQLGQAAIGFRPEAQLNRSLFWQNSQPNQDTVII